MEPALRCPQCKNKLLQKAGDTTRVRTQGPLRFDADGACRGQCYWCKSEVVLPVSLHERPPETPKASERPLLVFRKV